MLTKVLTIKFIRKLVRKIRDIIHIVCEKLKRKDELQSLIILFTFKKYLQFLLFTANIENLYDFVI